jgi:ribosome biogenesis ATPase
MSKPTRLLGALDNDVNIAVGKFLEVGVPADIDSIYIAIQRSNSSIKRKPKKVLQQSIERCLDFRGVTEDSGDDSEAALEKETAAQVPDASLMNRSLRANLSSGPSRAPSPPPVDYVTKKRRAANGEALPKRQKTEKVSVAPPGDVSLYDIGGIEDVLNQLKELLILPLLRPRKYIETNVSLPRGILLHGPPGCGKTMISRAFAAAIGVPFIEILGPSIVSGMSGESEKGVRERFEEAKKHAPCLIFIDEIDAIAPKRESSASQMEKRIVAQLLVSIDELERDKEKPVIVLAATNRPDALDPALRRGGRFDTEINIGVPNEQVRAAIMRAQTRGLQLAPDVDFNSLAKRTAGFVGADLKDLAGKAGSWQMAQYREALERQAEDLEQTMDLDDSRDISPTAQSIMRLISTARRTDIPEPPGFEETAITMAAFDAVLPTITPSSKREGFATIPDVSWEDIGALASVREELQTAIVDPIQNPERYAAVGISAPTGVLLWGPPGCGKTLLAKAVAAESKANFISIKGPELLNKYVGESEAAVRRVFMRARSSVPCVIFFDELDALVPRRDDSISEASSRVVNMLLTELDGLSTRAGIYVIGATNRPDMIDDAMMRPGRLETRLFVDLPGASERVEILRALIRNKPIPAEVAEIAALDACHGYSGADLESLIRKAGQHALKNQKFKVEKEDFEFAVQSIKGSVGSMDKYYKLRDKFMHRH